jgi:hypothetical protein
MQIQPSTVSLWVGSSIFAAFASYVLGSSYVLRIVSRYLTNGELEGGKVFALNMPVLFSAALATGGAITALISFFISWRRDRQPLLSWPHAVALLFVAPPVLLFLLLFR